MELDLLDLDLDAPDFVEPDFALVEPDFALVERDFELLDCDFEPLERDFEPPERDFELLERALRRDPESELDSFVGGSGGRATGSISLVFSVSVSSGGGR